MWQYREKVKRIQAVGFRYCSCSEHSENSATCSIGSTARCIGLLLFKKSRRIRSLGVQVVLGPERAKEYS